MSSTSDTESDEFFDAEDLRKKSPKNFNEKGFIYPESDVKNSEKRKTQRQHAEDQLKVLDKNVLDTNPQSAEEMNEFVEPKPSGRQRFREIRQNMQNDEDENIGNTLTPDSQNSSVEGVYYAAAQRTTHPFRIIEHDTASIQSMTSLGRVGRILAGSIDPSISLGRDSNILSKSSSSQQMSMSSVTSKSGDSETASINKNRDIGLTSTDRGENNSPNLSEKQIVLQEPDVIASTKLAHSKTTDSLISSGPIAPPRKKKKARKLSSSSSEQFILNEGMSLPPIDKEPKLSVELPLKNIDKNEKKEHPSPASAIESLTWELENTITGTILPSVSNKTIISKTGSLNRICHSLGNSSTSVNSKPSPCNSGKSNSAPGRVSSIDPNRGLNIYKATRGQYVVKPQDEVTNKADGPIYNDIERIRSEILEAHSSKRNLAGTGTNSLGHGARFEPLLKTKNSKERRKSAGDEEIIKQLNLYVRTRTDSGKQLTDLEILQQVPVKNLDTGENFPLSVVEEKLPELKKKMNPLSFHIMRLTSEVPEMDEESTDIPVGSEVPQCDEEEEELEEESRLKRKTERIKRFFGSTMRKTVDKAKSIASEVSHARHKEDVADVVDVVNPEQNIKIKASNTNKGPYEFAKLQHVQDLSVEHTEAVWCMKFSSCGRLLATAGQDKLLRIWVLKDAYPFFQDMRTKYNTDQKASPTPSQESLVSQSSSAEEASAMAAAAEKSFGPFMPKPFCTYTGHLSDLLDVSWSKNYFILSSSMDKTVRLWHISRKECLCCFQHIDFVTAIAFHPRDDRYFLSGSLDGKLRLWNIPDKKVALWNEVDGQTKLITAANFCQNGKFAVVGSYDGRCIFYTTDQLKYHTQIHVRSTRGKNATGRKISGIEPMPGEDKILVTSNDSRIRLYDLRDLNLSCKYKGYLNASSQIKASFSHDGKYIISGSENQCIFVWKTHHDYAKLSSVRRDRNDFWEGIKAHNATVTCAIFAPHPEAIIKPDPDDEMSSHSSQTQSPDPMVEQRKKGCGYVLVSADFNGSIKVFINKTKPKHSSLPYTAIMD